jgi:sialic acid synthase SpsE
MHLKDIFSNPDYLGDELLPPFIIAEAGVNHEGSMELAKRMIDEAQQAGADAIKFQTYKAATLAARKSPSYWDTSKESATNQFELFSRHDKFWKKEFEELKLHCDLAGIEFLSTPFDLESAAFLNPLMDVFKISSSDITNKPFIQHLCAFGKPVILSTGASELDEIRSAVGWIRASGNPLALLHCVLNYPTADENAALGMIKGLKHQFPGMLIGYSDHTLPADMKTLETATLLGARILEKHFTFDKSLPGNDHYHAMDKSDLSLFMQNMERILKLTGSSEVKALMGEETARQNARRSLVALGDLPAGTVIEPQHLTWKRPASGISPAEIDKLLGKRCKHDIADDSILHWEMFD